MHVPQVDLLDVLLLELVFFFQAEDGIRDIGVTGVQTCALPIYPARRSGPGSASRSARSWSTGPRARPSTAPAGASPGGRTPPGNGPSCSRRPPSSQNGRASGRERVEISAGALSLKKNSLCD